jgi:hypothetical protein
VITLRTPGPGATAVALNSNVDVTFSEVMAGVNGSTVAVPGTFQLRLGTATGAIQPASVTRAGTSNRWVLNPNGNLTRGRTYVVVLTGGTGAIRDVAGNPLASTTWTFTT